MIQGDPRPGSWQTIVPESDGVIDGATITGSRLLVRTLQGPGPPARDLRSGRQEAVRRGDRRHGPDQLRARRRRGQRAVSGRRRSPAAGADGAFGPRNWTARDRSSLEGTPQPRRHATAAGARQVQGRHGGPDHADPPPRRRPRRVEPDAALRLWRLRHLAVAVLLEPCRRVGASRRGLCGRHHSRRRRVRQHLARRRTPRPSSRTRWTTLPRRPSG